MSACLHTGYHSGSTRYDRERQRLRCVTVCDACGEEMSCVEEQDYRPDPLLGVREPAALIEREDPEAMVL